MPKTSRQLTVHPLTLREVEVIRVMDVTPGMRRVTLAGEQLRAFTSSSGHRQPAFVSAGFDDDVNLVFCYPGEAEPVLPVQQENGLITPRDPSPLSREYTVRRWSPEDGELDIDFVKHGIGVGTTWAYRAEPGDRIHLTGPSSERRTRSARTGCSSPETTRQSPLLPACSTSCPTTREPRCSSRLPRTPTGWSCGRSRTSR